MKLYQVTAQIVRVVNGWRESTGVPMFCLRDDVHGLISEASAELFARTMLAGIARDPTVEAIHITISDE